MSSISPRTLQSLSSNFCLPLDSVVKCLITNPFASTFFQTTQSLPYLRSHPRHFAVLSPVTLSKTQEVHIKIPFYCGESWDAKRLGSLLKAKELVTGRAEIRSLERSTCALPFTGVLTACHDCFMPDCGPRRHFLYSIPCIESTPNFFFFFNNIFEIVFLKFLLLFFNYNWHLIFLLVSGAHSSG